jgi:RNA-directed DNA polymerase
LAVVVTRRHAFLTRAVLDLGTCRLRRERAFGEGGAVGRVGRVVGIDRGVVSSETFSALDDYVWKLTYKWATYGHPNKSKRWVVRRYYGMFNRSRRDKWVFGDRASGVYLLKFAWTRIIRHQLVTGAASPDDPALAKYWAERRAKLPPPTIGKARWRLYKAQHGRCPLCGDWLQPAEDPPPTPREWERWLVTTRKTIKIAMRKDGASEKAEPRLLHTQCHRRQITEDGNGTSTSARPRASRACLSRMR